jgi:ribulose-phosphate 3-epimerase
MEIIPAILPKNFKEIEEKLSLVHDLASLVQIDVSDGVFTPERNWPYAEDRGEFQNLKTEATALPFWQEVDFEVHLMVKNPTEDLTDWVRAGAVRAIFHIEIGNDPVYDLLKEWGRVIEIGLAVNLETPLQSLEAYFGKVRTIQLMAIDRLGFQAQEFQPAVFDRIKKLRALGYKDIISVDGGVNLENAPEILALGAERLVVGSAIWQSQNVRETLRLFKDLVKNGKRK